MCLLIYQQTFTLLQKIDYACQCFTLIWFTTIYNIRIKRSVQLLWIVYIIYESEVIPLILTQKNPTPTKIGFWCLLVYLGL